jgi:hypothetical protein
VHLAGRWRKLKKWRISAVFRTWHGGCNSLDIPPDGPDGKIRRLKMTFNFANVQQLAVSALGAVLAATLFISAAVAPAAQFI